MEKEYSALREELLKRIEIRYNTISLSVTVAGALLGFSLQKHELALLYPLMALFFCCQWAQNEIRELQLCDYLHNLEINLKYGWSSFYKGIQGQGSFIKGIPLSVLNPGCFFVLTSIISLCIARSTLFSDVLHSVVSILNFFLIIIMLVLVLKVRNERLARREKKKRYYRKKITGI